jgi:hypothetical protein
MLPKLLVANKAIHMGSLIRYRLFFLGVVVLLLALSLVSIGCGSKSGQGTVKHFPLTLALSGPIGDTGSPLPEDIKALLMPVQVKNCSGILFIPDVKILRVDVGGAQPVDLDLGQEQNTIQRAAGQAPNPDRARSVREQALQKQQITSFMAQAGGPDTVTNENMKKLLSSPTNEHFFTYAGTKVTSLLNMNKVIVANDTTDLLSKIGLTFCSRPGEKPPNQLPISIIIYKPGTAIEDTGATPSSSSSTTGQSNNSSAAPSPATQTTQTQPTKEDADAALKQLSTEVETAVNDPAKKKAVHAQLAKAQAEFTWDYRFSYERAKLAVYGKAHHDEAFYHLYRAAEIAIDNGDADKMLQALQSDGNGVFHNLTDHGEWQTILNALRTKNSEMVRK